jgi:hypothetical protein
MSFIQAIKNGRPIQDLRDILVREKIDPKTPWGLHVSVIHNNKKAVKFLLDQGADVNIINNGVKPLHHSVSPTVDYDIMKLLLDRGATPNARGTSGNTPLILVAKNGCKNTLPNFFFMYNSQYVGNACKKLKLLIQYGAKVTYKNNDGYDALYYAIVYCRNNYDMVRDLVNNGASIDTKINATLSHRVSFHKSTPLDVALYVASKYVINSEAMKTVIFLVNKGAPIGNLDIDIFANIEFDFDNHDQRRVFEKIMRAMIKKETSLQSLAILLGKLLSRNITHIPYITSIFKDTGALSKREGKGAKSISIIDYLFLYLPNTKLFDAREYYRNKMICTIFKTNSIRLTEALHPFHVLVVAMSYCHSKPFDTTRKVKKIVDYLVSQGYDINERLERVLVNNKKTTAIPPGTAIEFLERRLSKGWTGEWVPASQRIGKEGIKALRDLHSIMVSRGAKTTTGRYSQRKKGIGSPMSWYISEWTTGAYRQVQNARRQPGQSTPSENTERINRYVAQAFRNHGTRAPVIPREFTVQWKGTVGSPVTNARPRYLYRGIHNPLADTLIKTGELKDAGYMAFSRNPSTASEFASKDNQGIVIRLPIDSIPRGTPWLWFKSGNTKYNRNVYTSNIDEDEVLLPPGTVRLRTSTLVKVHNGDPTIWDSEIEYIPDPQAASLTGARMYRKSAQPRASTKKRKRS